MMENKKHYNFSFRGKGGQFFGIVIVNLLLTILTLGIYYPWAKEKTLKYLYSNAYLENDSFQFTGTGKEMFIGYIKVYAIIIAFYIGIFFAATKQNISLLYLLIFIFYIGFLILIPFAIHGFYKYRMSRTNWRSIRFGYRGNRSTFTKLFFKELFFTIITLGIYSFWMETKIRNYTLSNIKFGSASFKYKADGGDYFILNLKGIFLTYITLGIYGFWFQRDLIRFYVDHLSLHHEGEKINFGTKISAGDIFELGIINLLIIVFTLGLGYPFVQIRTLNMILNKMEITGNIDLDTLKQTEAEYKDAFGDEALAVMDLYGFI